MYVCVRVCVCVCVSVCVCVFVCGAVAACIWEGLNHLLAKRFGGQEDSVHTCEALGLLQISQGEGQNWVCETQKGKYVTQLWPDAANKLGHPRAIYRNLQYRFQQLRRLIYLIH